MGSRAGVPQRATGTTAHQLRILDIRGCTRSPTPAALACKSGDAPGAVPQSVKREPTATTCGPARRLPFCGTRQSIWHLSHGGGFNAQDLPASRAEPALVDLLGSGSHWHLDNADAADGPLSSGRGQSSTHSQPCSEPACSTLVWCLAGLLHLHRAWLFGEVQAVAVGAKHPG
jgi:hypothetical protein